MSFVRTLALAALVSASFAGAAYARDALYTIKLEAPVSEQTRVIAQNTIWTCEGDTCRARSSNGANVRACRQFVRESGVRVSEFGSDADALSSDEIARCNGETATQQAQN